jgi:hypothetical protein
VLARWFHSLVGIGTTWHWICLRVCLVTPAVQQAIRACPRKLSTRSRPANLFGHSREYSSNLIVERTDLLLSMCQEWTIGDPHWIKSTGAWPKIYLQNGSLAWPWLWICWSRSSISSLYVTDWQSGNECIIYPIPVHTFIAFAWQSQPHSWIVGCTLWLLTSEFVTRSNRIERIPFDSSHHYNQCPLWRIEQTYFDECQSLLSSIPNFARKGSKLCGCSPLSSLCGLGGFR